MVNKIPETPDGIKVKSLYKAVQLLFYFTDEDKELGITELAVKSGLLKSTVYNILSTYEECGIVKKNPNTNKYQLGIRVLELSNQFYRNNDVRQIMRPYMESIANQEEECVYLAVLHDTEVIYVDAAFPSAATGGRNMTGVTAAAYCTGIGKAILAYQTESAVEQVIVKGFYPFTQNTITKGEDLKKELEIIRQRGYSVDNMEHEYGVKCVAVPIKNKEGKVIAAYSISGPSPRFDDSRIKRLAEELISNASKVVYQL